MVEYRQQFHQSILRSVNAGNPRALDQYMTITNAGRQGELEDLWIDGLIREQNAGADLHRAEAEGTPEGLESSDPEEADFDSDDDGDDYGGAGVAGDRPQRPATIIDGLDEESDDDDEAPEGEPRQGAYNDAVTSEGSLRDMFLGMVLGFLLSFTILFFWALDPNHSRRYKFGVVAGVGCNLALGFVHFAKSL